MDERQDPRRDDDRDQIQTSTSRIDDTTNTFEERLLEQRVDFEKRLPQQRMDSDTKMQRAQEQIDDFIRNQVETQRNCFWHNNMTLQEGPHSEESCLPVPANEIAAMAIAAERAKRLD